MLRAAQRHAASTEQRPRAGRQIGLKPAQRWACGGNFDTTRVTRHHLRRRKVVQNSDPSVRSVHKPTCVFWNALPRFGTKKFDLFLGVLHGEAPLLVGRL